MLPFVTILVPCYNEERFIASVIENILGQDYPSDRLEAFIIDGMSSDGTRGIIRRYAEDHPRIRLVDNERRYVPFGLNSGIRLAKGEVIVRMDAHALYPANYVSVLAGKLIALNADNVGGRWITNPANDSPKAHAIATALSSVFGVGNAHYRLEGSEVRKADTVPFGCFRRSLFERIGMYDEELLRNQDDELNARIIQNGGSIYLIPDVAINYYARGRVISVLRMFYQYSFFKPLVNRKLRRPATLRQFAPPLFVLFLLFGWIPALFSKAFLLLYPGVIGMYLILNLAFSVKNAFTRRKPYLVLYLPWIFFLQHLAYGAGYLHGIFSFTILKKKPGAVASTR